MVQTRRLIPNEVLRQKERPVIRTADTISSRSPRLIIRDKNNDFVVFPVMLSSFDILFVCFFFLFFFVISWIYIRNCLFVFYLPSLVCSCFILWNSDFNGIENIVSLLYKCVLSYANYLFLNCLSFTDNHYAKLYSFQISKRPNICWPKLVSST